MAERVGVEPTQPRRGGWPPGSNRALFQAQSPLHGGSGGSRTHTGRVLSPLPLPIGLRSRWCPSPDSNREPLASEASASANWARGAIERTWRRVEGSNPRQFLVAPVFGTGCRPLQRHPPEMQKAPAAHHRGGFFAWLLFALRATRLSPWRSPAKGNLRIGTSSA